MISGIIKPMLRTMRRPCQAKADPSSFVQSLQAIRLGGQIHMIGERLVGSKAGEMNPLEILYRRAVVRGIPIGLCGSPSST